MTSPVSQWGRFAWHQQMWPHYRGVTDVVGKDFCDGKIFCWSIRMIYQSQLNYFIWFEGGIKRRGNKPEHLIRLYLMRIIWWEPSLHHPEHGATDVPHKSISSEDNLHYWVSFSVIVSRDGLYSLPDTKWRLHREYDVYCVVTAHILLGKLITNFTPWISKLYYSI